VTLKPGTWYPIALVLSGINLVAIGFAVRPLEPLHAMTHAALALAFGFWARRLRQSPAGGGSEHEARLEALSAEVSALRRELGEMHERLDFAERLLAQRPDAGRVGPQR
jgi:hypothetical protein